MAIIDKIGLCGNDRVRESRVLVGTLEIGADTVSGDIIQIGAIPARAIVKSCNMVVTTAVDGTSPAVDVGTSANGAYYANDLAVTTTGLTVSAGADAYFENGTVLTVTPTLNGATKGTVRVYVEYLTDIFTGTYATEQ